LWLGGETGLTPAFRQKKSSTIAGLGPLVPGDGFSCTSIDGLPSDFLVELLNTDKMGESSVKKRKTADDASPKSKKKKADSQSQAAPAQVEVTSVIKPKLCPPVIGKMQK